MMVTTLIKKKETLDWLVEGCDDIDNMRGGLGYVFLYSR
jgi:hypothetical protein